MCVVVLSSVTGKCCTLIAPPISRLANWHGARVLRQILASGGVPQKSERVDNSAVHTEE